MQSLAWTILGSVLLALGVAAMAFNQRLTDVGVETMKWTPWGRFELGLFGRVGVRLQMHFVALLVLGLGIFLLVNQGVR